MKFDSITKIGILLITSLGLLSFPLPSNAAQYKNVAAGRCMNVFKQRGTDSGYSKVILFDCVNNDPEQDWLRTPNGNIYFQLKLGANDQYCMNISSPVINQYAFPYQCLFQDPGQMLDFEPQSAGSSTGRLQFAGKGVCLSAVKQNNRIPLWQNYDFVISRACNNSNEQKWIRQGTN